MSAEQVHVVTGVWYHVSYGHTTYHHFPYEVQINRHYTDSSRCISALDKCEPITNGGFGADYDILNGSSPRPTRELIDLTKGVCDEFLSGASLFANVKLPMIKVYIERWISGATCYRGNHEHMSIKQNDDKAYGFIYSKVKEPVTPSNISDVLGKRITNINVVQEWPKILWKHQSQLAPDTPLYIYNIDKYDDEGGVYVKILDPNTDVVNTNLCLVHPSMTRHIPPQMAELFRQKTVPVMYHAQKGAR